MYIIFYIQYILTFTLCILVSLLKCLFISWHHVFSKTKKSSLKCPSFYWLTNHVIFIYTCNRPKTALITRLFHPSYHEAWVDFSLVKKPENDRLCLSAARGRSLAAPENCGEIWTPRKQNYKANLDIRTTDHWNPGSTWPCKNGNVYHPFKLKKECILMRKSFFGALGCIKKFGLTMLYE